MRKMRLNNTFALQFLLFVMSIGLAGCSSGSNSQNGYSSLLRVNVSGTEYLIMSFSPKDTEGYNLLIREENNKIIIKCIDRQQDGIIDEVVEGNISIDEANIIYSKAIQMAESKGSVKKKYFERYYRMTAKDHYYEIQTYILASGERYNIFTVVEKTTNNTFNIVDENADGLLDTFQTGGGEIKIYQQLYEMVIQEGIKDKRIHFENGIYQVNK